jgi:hypothetical protein
MDRGTGVLLAVRKHGICLLAFGSSLGSAEMEERCPGLRNPFLPTQSLGGSGNRRSRIVGAIAKATTENVLHGGCLRVAFNAFFFSFLRMIVPAVTSLQEESRMRRCAV